MPFEIPTLGDLRRQNRDAIVANLPGADATIPNSALRVLSDSNAGLAYLTLLYLEWLSRQIMVDTAEREWLDRFAQIWVGGRKAATFAVGEASLTGVPGTVLPIATRLRGATGVEYETTEAAVVSFEPTPVPIRALEAGDVGNQLPGAPLTISVAVAGVDGSASTVSLSGGISAENDDDLRTRVLLRIRRPPMGGDADDYVQWALEVPGVTRAWCAPLEMGPGTVTVRFMMDELRANEGGFPLAADLIAVRNHLDLKRPVAVKDFFVVAPIPSPITLVIPGMTHDDASTRAAVITSLKAMLRERAAPAFAYNGVLQPAQTIYEGWIARAILSTAGVEHIAPLVCGDFVMPSNGHMATLGTVDYD